MIFIIVLFICCFAVMYCDLMSCIYAAVASFFFHWHCNDDVFFNVGAAREENYVDDDDDWRDKTVN